MAEFLCLSILRLGYPYSDRYQALFRIFTSMSESSLRVIVLSSLVNPYPEFNTEWAKCIVLTLVNKASDWINWSKKGEEKGAKSFMNDFAPFFGVIVMGGVYQRGAADTNKKKRIWDGGSVRSFTVKCSLHFHELLIILSTGFDSEFRRPRRFHKRRLSLSKSSLACSRHSMSFKIFNVYDSLACNL